MKEEQNEAILRLFKSFVNEDQEIDINSVIIQTELQNRNSSVDISSLDKGIIYNGHTTAIVKELAEKMYGKSGEDWNKTFHKSIAVVKDTPIEKLIGQQLIHYFTTYGFEELGIFNSDLVYFPGEKLEIPDLEEDIPLIVIHQITQEELTEKLMILITSGIALSESSIKDIMTLSDYISKDAIDNIKNKEIRIYMYNKYNIVPQNNMEFLRYVVYKLTNNTLFIKDKTTLSKLQEADTSEIYDLLMSYIEIVGKNGYRTLAQIFDTQKDIFISLKRKDKRYKYAKEINSFINRVSKLSKKYRIPYKEGELDYILDKVSNNVYSKEDLYKELDNVTIYKIISILNGLRYRINVKEGSIVYKIRNGKGFVDTNYLVKSEYEQAIVINYEIIYKYLLEKIKERLENKTVYIPQNVEYTLPQSEKQFNGNIPEGSYIEVDRYDDMVVGVYWKNLEDERVDLDLKAQNKNVQVGWDAMYRNKNNSIIFSGDVTDAPNGACEVINFTKDCNNATYLMTLNDYTRNNEDVPYKILIAENNESVINKNYIVDPNLIKFVYEDKFKITGEENPAYQKTLGICEIKSDSVRFYFNDFTLGSAITSSMNSKYVHGAYEYIDKYKDVQLKLKDVLIDAQIDIVSSPNIDRLEEVGKDENGDTLYKKIQKPVDYDLSLENITKETLIEMLM